MKKRNIGEILNKKEDMKKQIYGQSLTKKKI